MCGIVGYIGPSPACNILVEGLKKLEYRGYDSAGVAVVNSEGFRIVRAKGKIRELEKLISGSPVQGTIGVGHTRWATHGRPSEINAHPHRSGKVVVVHNGIIENYTALKKRLASAGHTFDSETDTEVIAHLIDFHRRQGMDKLSAIRQACNELEGSFASGILMEDEPDTLYGIRKESPLIVGVGAGEAFLGSDIPAILGYTRRMMFMEDGEIAVLKSSGVQILGFDGQSIERAVKEVNLNPVMAEKSGYKHFMLKEIHEQPRAVTDTFRGRISADTGRVFLDGLTISEQEMGRIGRIVILACGTSFHAGLVGRRIIEDLTRIPVEVDLASEFRYRNPIVGEDTLAIGISQSGETADTLAAVKEAAARGAMTVSICNVMESSITRISSHGTIYTHAGPEIGVASTKAFTTQLTVLYLLGIYLASSRGYITADTRTRLVNDLMLLPGRMEEALSTSDTLADVARMYEKYTSFLYLGRSINTPIAYEGALKLKEISYIHAEAYPGGEMKHGPIALISEEMPVVVVLSQERVYGKMLSNMEEVKSRGGILLVFLAGEEDPEVDQLADQVVRVPAGNEFLTTILLTLPLQLLAYHIADFKGTDIDQPRNLAKSVTVE